MPGYTKPIFRSMSLGQTSQGLPFLLFGSTRSPDLTLWPSTC
jgi:hypothetical protein